MAKNSLLKNTLIVGGSRMCTILITFATTIVLARLLTPSDFGTVAMCSIFLSIAQVLVESGLGGSIIYYKDTSEDDYHTVFWFNMVISVVLYIVLLLCSGIIADFYGVPILASIIKLCGLSIVVHSTCLIQSSLLSKNLQFKTQTRILITSSILTAITVITMAYVFNQKNMGIWALASQHLMLYFYQSILFIVKGHYRPKFVFKFNLLKKHWEFGSRLMGTSILHMIYQNMYVQLIGKVVEIGDAGYYNQAKKLNDVPMHVIQYPLERVLFPTLTHSTDFNGCTKVILNAFAFVLIPILFLGSVLAPYLVTIILGSKWGASGWMLSIMFIGTIGASLENLNRSFIKATGQTGVLLKTDFVKRLVCIGIVILCLKWGIKGVLCAFVFNGFLGWMFNCLALNRITNSGILVQIGIVVRTVLFSTMAMGAAYWVDSLVELSVWGHLLVLASVYLAVIAVVIFGFRRKELKEMKKLLFKKKNQSK